jgi:tetratricopeptide (TPR) repeat protein
MNTIILFSALLILKPSHINDVKRLYEEGRFKDAKKELNNIEEKSKNSDDFLFYSALLEEDGEKSFSYLQELTRKYPESKHYDHAQYSIGLFYFLKEEYSKSVTKLIKIAKSKKESAYKILSFLWIASSYEALNDTTNALIWYKKIPKNSSQVFHTAQLALKRLAGRRSIYAIQIGSFENSQRAKNFTATFIKKGYDAWLATTQKDGKKYFRVLIGNFTTKEKAKGFSTLFSEKEKIPYWIIKVKKL